MPIPANFSKPERTSAKQRAFLQIQQWIIDGTLQPGEKLNDGELAQALGVSRTPIREALQLLDVQGFVEMYPGVATKVTSVKREDISKILPPLAALQALAAELATSAITEADIDALREINNEFAQSINQIDFYAALKSDEVFHRTIVEIADNIYITDTISNLQAHVRRLFFHDSIILTTRSIEEHENILNAFERHDAITASSIARTNWLRPIEELHARED